MTPGDVKHSLILWASSLGVYDLNPSEPLDSDAEIITLPLTDEHAECFRYRKIFKIKLKGKKITIATKMSVKKDKSDTLRKLLEDEFASISLSIEFSVEKEFKIDQKVRSTLNPLYWSNNKIACGSSIGIGNQRNAGTLTALGQYKDGRTVGISCNHVIGGCNTTQKGTPIVCPGILDVSPNSPVIYGVGLHLQSGQMFQGLPADSEFHMNNSDFSIFEISDDSSVTTSQGEGIDSYDTPTKFVEPKHKMLVKKWGRTTGFTKGRINKILTDAEPMPYDVRSYYGPSSFQVFKGVVYYQNLIEVENFGARPFSEAGDSGALVVTVPTKPNEKEKVVGVLIGGSAGNNSKSYVLPIQNTLKSLGVSLITGI